MISFVFVDESHFIVLAPGEVGSEAVAIFVRSNEQSMKLKAVEQFPK